jgi:hypothetical protein
LHQQLARRLHLGQLAQAQAAGALRIQRQGQLVGHQAGALIAGVLRALLIFFIHPVFAEEATRIRVTGLARGLEAEAREALRAQGRVDVHIAQLGRHAHRQAGRATAVAVVHLQAQRQLARLHQRVLGASNAARQHRQSKFFDAEAAGLHPATTVAQHHAVGA